MNFELNEIDNFLSIFNAHKQKIRNFKGCTHLELLRDVNNTNIIFTYSYWESEQHLEDYRKSELFKDVWSKTKKLFNNKPEAWSVERVETIE